MKNDKGVFVLKAKPVRFIAVPSSLFIDFSLREKTLKTGYLGRTISIFKVQKVFIYDTPSQRYSRNAKTVKEVLEYQECPQYLRKYFFPLNPKLKYAGILPPLRAPHHPRLNDAISVTGGYREGCVVRVGEGRSFVDVGLKKSIVINESLYKGSRVTVKLDLTKDKPTGIATVNAEDLDVYWGFDVKYVCSTLSGLAESSGADLILATSRYGIPVEKISKELSNRMKASKELLILFGAQDKGLYDIAKLERESLEDIVDYTINFIPGQGVETVRTEEALYSTLSIINFLNVI